MTEFCNECSCHLHYTKEVDRSECDSCFYEKMEDMNRGLIDNNMNLLISRDNYKALAWTFFICMILMSLTYWWLAWRLNQ